MKLVYRVLLAAVIIAAAIIFSKALIGTSTLALLAPAGPVALYQRDLIRNAVLLMLVIVIPFLATFYYFAWKYRAGNPDSAKYEPDKKHGAWKEIGLWAMPSIIVLGLAILGWNGAHAVDPFSPITANGSNGIAPGTPTLNIEVVALPWKWLFIYPQQNIATVNFLEFPVNTPIHFELTADGPISSFWIPQLGSQIYAMAAMSTQLNLEATRVGEFVGKDTEINGTGYAGMQFEAKSVVQPDFDSWVASVAGSATNVPLDAIEYATLAATSSYNPPAYYSSVEPGLFDGIMMKYMEPTSSMPSDMPGMQM